MTDCSHDRAIPSLDHGKWGGWYCPDCRKGCGKPGQFTPPPPRETLGLPPLLVKPRPPGSPPAAAAPAAATVTNYGDITPPSKRPWEKWLTDPPVPGGAPPPPAPPAPPPAPIEDRSDPIGPEPPPPIDPVRPGQLTNSPGQLTNSPGQLTNPPLESSPPFAGPTLTPEEQVCKRFVNCQDWEENVTQVQNGWHPQAVYRVPSKGRYYFRYIAVEGSRHLINKHIPGGSVDNPLAQERAAQVEAAIDRGAKPAEVVNMIVGWTAPRRKAVQ